MPVHENVRNDVTILWIPTCTTLSMMVLMLLQCNSPTYVGDGTVCGIDTDYDGFPDVNLNCDIAPFCEEVSYWWNDQYSLLHMDDSI